MLEFKKLPTILPLTTLILLIFGNPNCNSAHTGPYFEDIIVEYFNESFIDPETFDLALVYKSDGKNAIKHRTDMIQDLPINVHLKCIVSARVLGNYIQTGLSVDGELCQSNGLIGFYAERVLIPMGYSCPIKKGSYHHDGFIPDFSKLPINLISGTHLVFDTLLYTPDGIQIISFKAYIVL